MAQVTVRRQETPTRIEVFKGINEDSAGDTQLKIGESPDMVNFRLTENSKLRKRGGYTALFADLDDIQGMWQGKLTGSYHFLFASKGAVWHREDISGTRYDSIDTATYSDVDVVKTTALNTSIAGTTGIDGVTLYQDSSGTDLTEGTEANIDLLASVGKYYYHTDKTIWIIVEKGLYANIAAARIGLGSSMVYVQIGTLTDAKTSFFAFGNKVYMQNGYEYKSWNGTTFGDVAGYIPLIATATPPTGGGTANEGVNLLTGKKHQWFSGNGSDTAYQLPETAITSVDQVYVGGVLKTVTTDYTVNLTTGIVTFLVAPASGVDNVDIYWTKGTGSRSEVTGHRFSMLFGGQNDTRVFAYGNGTNRYNYTGLAAGVPSAEYFPALYYRQISSDEFEVTDIVRQYDRQIIYTSGGETWYSYYDPITDINGDVVPDFPTFPLNDSIGNIAPGQAQLIENNPFSIQSGVYAWQATNVRDERNVVNISKRVQPSLDDVDLTTAITVDWEAKKEYWLAIGNKVWVYNYLLDAWYKFTLADPVTCFLIVNDDLYFGTDNTIMKFDNSRTDDGTAIDARWEMNFYDFKAEWLRKFINEMWISIKPDDKTSATVYYETDRVSSGEFTAIYNLATFENADFGDWSFLTNYNPQPFRFKIKAKKFVYFKLIITNDEVDEALTFLSITLPARMGSKVK